jgi:iron(II)-dependent oxidoreductase
VTDLRERIATELSAVRRRSLTLLDPLDEPDLLVQHSPLMSPLVWDLAHVGNYEDLWLLRPIVKSIPEHPEYDELYDAFKHPRKDRPRLPILEPGPARDYIGGVRSKVLDVLDQVDLDSEKPLLHKGFVYGMVIQHEHQHDETMLATLQLKQGDGYRPAGPSAPRGRPVATDEILIPGGPFVMGTDDEPWAYDNERAAHTVDLPAYFIDTTPVTNSHYAEFVAAGGYDQPQWWGADGWKWRQEEGLEHPQFWHRDISGGWLRDRFGHIEPLPPGEPVQHVCWHEADAYARWAGKRLPTEAEWEKAASWGPDDADRKRRYPWGDDEPDAGRANLGGSTFGPAGAGAYPAGASAYGVQQLIGDVWEWTASDFAGYPGFAAFPYREYSEVFFGPKYKVLRGGSWATHPTACRNTFRNWDLPIRRQIFAGFRCARDAEPIVGAGR